MSSAKNFTEGVRCRVGVRVGINGILGVVAYLLAVFPSSALAFHYCSCEIVRPTERCRSAESPNNRGRCQQSEWSGTWFKFVSDWNRNGYWTKRFANGAAEQDVKCNLKVSTRKIMLRVRCEHALDNRGKITMSKPTSLPYTALSLLYRCVLPLTAPHRATRVVRRLFAIRGP